ncbi:DUF4386 domain-containing protein [Flagellimonas allohymeniacidonis]|nr:DUF4386 domain-containing protein [Allomuricauda hymeniacidonis]
MSLKQTARLAGFLFFILVVTGVFAEFYVRQNIFVYKDIAATARNIIENEWLFRLGFVADLVMSTAFFFYAFLLYIVFKNVHKNGALLLFLSITISVAMYCQNMLYQFSALELLQNKSYSEGFGMEQLELLSSFFLNMHGRGYMVNQIFYGLYLFPLGYMIYKSGVAPKWLGIILMLGCLGDFVDFVTYFLFPNTSSVVLQNITIPADVGELLFCLWLMIWGVREKNIKLIAMPVRP